MKNRKAEVLKFYLKLFSSYKQKHGDIYAYDDVLSYFFDRLPTQTKKMRIIRNISQSIPTFVILLILKILSFRKKRYRRISSAIIIELAASAAVKRNPTEHLEVYDQTSSGKKDLYLININTLAIDKRDQGDPKRTKPPINFQELEISALSLLDPYLVGALEIIDVVTNFDRSHGCNYGWYQRNEIETFERKFSDHYIVTDINSFATFYRYLSAPTY